MAHPDDSYPELLSLAVHEFRTPASVVGGYLRMLLRDTDPPLSQRQRKMVDEAEKSCARIVALVAELSEIAKLDAGQVTVVLQPLDVFTVVQEVAEGVHEAEEREIRLEVRGTAAGAQMLGDPIRLRSAFQAIFRAILREAPGPATLVVERKLAMHDGRSSAVLVIADTGGVQAGYEAPRAMFDEKRGGVGLALPLARRVIEAHGGRVWSPRDAAKADDQPVACAAIIAFPLPELNP